MKASDKAKYQRILEMQAEAMEMEARLDRMENETERMTRRILIRAVVRAGYAARYPTVSLDWLDRLGYDAMLLREMRTGEEL